MLNDPSYLLKQQYSDASNLNARIALHKLYNTNTYDWPRWVFDQLDFPDAAHILELGAGPAQLWSKNLDRIPSGWHIIVSDFSAGMQEQARQNLAHAAHPFQFQQFDAQDIPLADASLDAVIANHMLYHVPDRPKAFAEMARVLKPGGRLVAATNGLKHMAELSDMIQRFAPDLGHWRSNQRSHLNFSLESGGEQLAAWFDDVTMIPYESSLIITEPEPLIAYILSAVPNPQEKAAEMAPLVAHIRREIEENGVIHIQKATGLFLARKQQS